MGIIKHFQDESTTDNSDDHSGVIKHFQDIKPCEIYSETNNDKYKIKLLKKQVKQLKKQIEILELNGT